METAAAVDTKPPVMVLDDDPEFASFVAAAMRRAGYQPVVAPNHEVFFRELTDEHSIVIIDLMLPGQDGILVLRELGKLGFEGSIVLVSTVDVRVLGAAERLAAGHGLRLLGSLRKPFQVSELLDVVTAKPPPLVKKTAKKTIAPVSAQELKRGLDADEFVVHFQPKVEVQSLEFVSVEALARWAHPEKGILSPAHFIGVAENNDLIGLLTATIIRKAFHQCAEWLDAGLRLRVAVNVSTRSLGDYDLPEWFEEQTREAGILPHQVVIEVTESWLGKDPLAMLEILTRMRMKGFSLSIDDFGTGYSTMLKLKTIPFSELKLDQSFIRDAASDAEARYIVESSISLGQKLGLNLVAEGVERQEDWDLITELGCDEGQGYFIARPMRGRDVPHWLRRWQAYLGKA
ncbi:MAG: EAL domain-containing response regulator [Gammaproteobacteria bacterium]|nr:EAL domain-containing response regulator [Gammaproteobacteria bacterium]MDH3767444.1 EAL domain-containing response regulator [Gammaproteobacteria bacterium]